MNENKEININEQTNLLCKFLVIFGLLGLICTMLPSYFFLGILLAALVFIWFLKNHADPPAAKSIQKIHFTNPPKMRLKRKLTSFQWLRKRKPKIRKFKNLLLSNNLELSKNTDQLYFKTKVNGLEVKPMVDSGSQACLISKDLFYQIPNWQNIPIAKDCQTQLIDHNRNEIPQASPPRMLTFDLNGKKFEHPVFVTDNGCTNTFLVGMCFLRLANISLVKVKSGYIMVAGKFNKPEAVMPTSDKPQTIPNTLFADSELKLQPGEIHHISCYAQEKLKNNLTIGLGVVSPIQNQAEIQAIEGLQDIKTVNNMILVQNTSPYPFLIRKGDALATFECMQIGDKIKSNTKSELVVNTGIAREINQDEEKIFEDFEEDVSTLPPGFDVFDKIQEFDLKDYLKQDEYFPKHLLNEFLEFIDRETPNVVSKHDQDIGTITFDLPYDIELSSEEPIVSKPYHLNEIRQAQIDKAIKRLVDVGILEPGESEYCSPIFIIPKKSDNKTGITKLRCIFDFRKINKFTRKKNHPLPNIETLLHDLSGASYYTSIDLSSAFHSVPLSPNAQKKAAIITPKGIFLSKRLSFGLCNAPSHFARVMSHVLKDLPKGVRHFQDDLIIFTKDPDPKIHLELIKTVFRRLQEMGLKINGKGEFFRQEIAFLGKVLNKDGIRPLKKHIDALESFPKPKTIKHVQQFLGLVSWMHNFIHNFAVKIEPLCQVIRKREFEWTMEADIAFEKLKKEITDKTFLYHLDFEAPIYLASDICQDSYAGVLYQVKSYSTDDLEALEDIKLNMNTKIESSIKTDHPVLPKKRGPGIPAPTSLQAEDELQEPKTGTILDHTKNLQDQINSVRREEFPNLDTLMGEKDKVHVLRVIAFTSGLFKGPQQNYSVYEKECFGVLKSIETFKDFLYCGKEVYVISDSQSFIWALGLRNLGLSKIERMIIKLFSLPYKIVVSHIPGHFMISDHLTRTLAFKVKDVTPGMGKKAMVIESPFPTGQIIDKQDIINALKEKQLLHIPTKEEVKKLNAEEKAEKIVSNVSTTSVSSVKRELETLLTKDNILLEQRLDPLWKEKIRKLKNSDSKVIDGFTLRNGVLCKISKDPSTEEDSQIVIPKSLVGALFALYHIDSHAGAASLAKMIREDFYVQYLDELLRDFTSSCHLCVMHKAKNNKKEQLGSTPLPTRKGKTWILDFVTALPPYSRFNSYLSIIDSYSGFRIAIPCSSEIKAKEAIRLFHSHVVQIFSIPDLIASDAGPNLVKSKDFQKYAEYYGISTHVYTPHSAKSHGYIEVSNRVITETLKILSDQYNRPWPEILPFLITKLNSRPRPHFQGLSPNQIIFGKNDILPSNDKIKEDFEKLHKETDKLIEKAMDEMKKQNETQSGVQTYLEPGTLVFVKNYAIVPKMKWKHKFISAPNMVMRDYGKSLLVKDFNQVIKLVHKDSIKHCNPRSAELYRYLPPIVKAKLGFPYTIYEIQEAIQKGEIPDFWTKQETFPSIEPPQTRQRTRQEEQNQEQVDENVILLPQLEEDENDNNDSENKAEKRVRFNFTES